MVMLWVIIYLLGHMTQESRGLPQDEQKANELWLKAGELGCASGYYNLAVVIQPRNGCRN